MLSGNSWTYVYKLPITEQTWILINRESGSDPFENGCEWHGRVKEGRFDQWTHVTSVSINNQELKERIHSLALTQSALKKSKTTFRHKEIKDKIKEIFVSRFIKHLTNENAFIAKAALMVLFPQRDVEMYFDYKTKRKEGFVQLDKLMCQFIKEIPSQLMRDSLRRIYAPFGGYTVVFEEIPTAES
jgi:hypothetical protein